MDSRALTPASSNPTVRPVIWLIAVFLAAAPAWAQLAPAVAAERAALAKYDQNQNGRLDPEELAAKQKDEEKLAAAVGPKAATTPEGAVVELSPFVVTSDNDRGYQATNTMSGTRLNSKLEDVAASVSVVTKQQLNDFALLDLNDIFATEVSTEGIRTYTQPGNDPRGDVDNVALNPTTANRIRGIGSANMAVGGFALTSSIPIDTYNVDAVEISKGPNSSIFGVGEVSGTVNLVPASANLQRAISTFNVSGSSYGSRRASLDLNRPVLKGKLALRVLALANQQEYVRKPSYDNTRRLQFGATARPFPKTTLRVSYEKFEERYSRANTMMPRDYMSLWQQVGRPSWDPTTSTWTYTDANGVVQRGTVASSGLTGNTVWPAAVWLGSTGSGGVRPSMFIDGGKSQWFGLTRWTSTDPAFPNRELALFAVPTGAPVYYGLPNGYIPSTNPNVASTLGYQAIRATASKQFYNYDDLNLSAINRAQKDGEFFRFEFEQFLVTTERHTLAAQLAGYKELIGDYSKAYVGNGGDGISFSVQPDVNTRLPDGTPNPFFGRPWVGALSPQIYSRPVHTRSYKLNLAYQLDLGREKSWLRFLGQQKLLGYMESLDKRTAPSAIRFSEQITQTFPASMVQNNGNAWLALPTNGNFSRNNNAIWNARYYLGDTVGGGVAYAPAAPDLSQGATFRRWGNDQGLTTVASNQWLSNTVPFGETYYTLGTQQTQLRTKGFIWQGMFLDSRIVTTYGRREDSLRTRNGPAAWADGPAALRDSNGFYTDTGWLWDFGTRPWAVANRATGSIDNRGATDTKGLVLKPLRWLHLRYNTSNSLQPQGYVLDFNAEPLPNPHGTTKDYGVTLNLFKNQLVLNLTRFETKSVGARPGSGVASRVFQIDFDTPYTTGTSLALEHWLVVELQKDPANAALTQDQLIVKADQIAGLSADYLANLRNNATAITQDVTAKGYELEMNWNPSRHLTLKVNGSQTESIISAYGAGFNDFIADRMKVWTAVVSPFDKTTRFWDNVQPSNKNGYNSARDWFQNLVWNPMQLALALQGLPQPQVRKYKANTLASYRLAGLTDRPYFKAMSVGGSLRWEDKGAIGFYGAAPVSDPANPDAGKVFVRAYDPKRPIYDSAHTYLDLFWGYDFRMLASRVRAHAQLNVRNVTESGRLQPVGVNPDGTYYNYRIVDPREFVLSLRFDL